MMFDLSHKKALVTGASKGIGRAIALSLAEQGVDLVISARTKAELEHLAGELKNKAVTCHYVVADLAKHEDVIKLAKKPWPFTQQLTFWSIMPG